MTTLFEEKYGKCVTTVRDIFSKVEDFAFTCDSVTITKSTRSYLINFINEECLESICLSAVRMD